MKLQNWSAAVSEAQEKKVFYNRVRRTCKLFNIDIVYDGPPMAYGAVDLFKDGEALGIACRPSVTDVMADIIMLWNLPAEPLAGFPDR